MRPITRSLSLAAGLGVLASVCAAQSPPNGPAAPPRSGARSAAAIDAMVARIMTFDKNQDGKLTRDEITDGRLLRLFDRADADKNGVVTKAELTALATQLAAEAPVAGGPGGFGGPGGPDGFGPGGGPGGPGGFGAGGPGGFGPGGPGGFGPGGRGPGGPPQPGQIFPSFLQERLNLTAEQKQQIDALQKEVDARLGKILTADQKQRLAAMRQRGPGRFGGPGGPPPGGPPPGDFPPGN